MSLCFGKKWGDWQISAKVTFIRAKLPKIPKFPILLARSNRMSESSVLLKSQPDRTRNADFLLLATFGALSLCFSKPPISFALSFLSFIHRNDVPKMANFHSVSFPFIPFDSVGFALIPFDSL